MDKKYRELVFADDSSSNWFFKNYYYSGSNSRYWTFQLALNILVQRVSSPVIIETGCQRQADDLGAGMSTSILGEFCQKYNGKLYTVDLIAKNLEVCKACTTDFASEITYVHSDSVKWLKDSRNIKADLLYLDSYDHPYGEMLNDNGGRRDIEAAIKKVSLISHSEVLRRYKSILEPCQQHCLNEFLAAEESGKLKPTTIVLIDDNQLPGGGKSRLVKNHLVENNWTCLFDLQQSLWVRKL